MTRNQDKHIERIVTIKEIKSLVERKNIVIALFKYKFKNYELIGYLKEV